MASSKTSRSLSIEKQSPLCFSDIVKAIDKLSNVTTETTREFDVVPAVATKVFACLDRIDSTLKASFYAPENKFRITVMPVFTHQCVLEWVQFNVEKSFWGDKILSKSERLGIQVYTEVRHKAPGHISQKMPDAAIRNFATNDPHIVFEVGWSESYPQLLRDKELWFEFPSTNIVVLVKWTPSDNTKLCAGILEVHKRCGNSHYLDQTVSIWPEVSNESQTIEFKKSELLENPGIRIVNPSDIRDAMHGATSLLQSRIAIVQGDRLKTLTYLGIAYLPLGTVSSIYSMTVLPKEASLGSYFVVLAIFLVLTLLLVIHIQVVSQFRDKPNRKNESRMLIAEAKSRATHAISSTSSIIFRSTIRFFQDANGISKRCSNKILLRSVVFLPVLIGLGIIRLVRFLTSTIYFIMWKLPPDEIMYNLKLLNRSRSTILTDVVFTYRKFFWDILRLLCFPVWLPLLVIRGLLTAFYFIARGSLWIPRRIFCRHQII